MKHPSPFLRLAAITALLLAGTAQASDLRMLTSYGTNTAYTQNVAERFMEMVATASDGTTRITLQGPDVVPPMEQLQPVAAGVFDLLYTHGAYHTDTTGVGAAMDAITVDPVKTRETGLWDVIDAHYNELGLKVIAIVPLGSSGFQYVLKNPISGVPSLQGMRLRGSPTYTNITTKLGGAPVLMSSGEVYSAMDRGVIDGAAWGLNGVRDLGWYEVAGYFTKPTFGQTYTLVLMNLNRFNSLDAAEQALLLEQGRELEISSVALLDELAVKEWDELRALGMQETRFAPEDVPNLTTLVNEGIWQLGLEKTPQVVARMKEIAEENGMTD
ncbi:MAG: TRAP transporter substrate-binding protein DctP [Paracoccus sp. (in: a-proteobacteria)]|nr:TRAP transporter substrate-binding protein DctP [Paracoccus sp. (in: a-proteobacteria)]